MKYRSWLRNNIENADMHLSSCRYYDAPVLCQGNVVQKVDIQSLNHFVDVCVRIMRFFVFI